MSTVANDDPTRCLEKSTLLSLLSNHLVLQNTSPYLSPGDRLALGATCQSFRELIYLTTGVFRHLDLTHVKSAQFDIDPIDNGGEVWRNVQLDENVTEDDFYSGPLRGIFGNLQRRHLLRDVQTLILDGLSVTADFCNEILVDATYNVRILSVRDAKHLNERKLRGALKYACRPNRAAGMPKLKGVYVFSDRETPARRATASASASASLRHGSGSVLGDGAPGDDGDDWYETRGRVISRVVSPEWAETMLDCQAIVGFDAVLCSGPSHFNSPAFGVVSCPPSGKLPITQWAVATFAVSGCTGCGSAPEGSIVYRPNAEPGYLPLLSPVPTLSSSLKAATCPSTTSGAPSFVARCLTCLEGRYCRTCHKWWCEKCYVIPMSSQPATGDAGQLAEKARANSKVPISRSCVECGFSCSDCISRTQKRCSSCNAEYCIVHHEGSSSTLCDWCSNHRRTTPGTHKAKHPPQQKPTGQTKDAWMAWMRQQHSAPERAMKTSRQRVVIRDVRCCSPRR